MATPDSATRFERTISFAVLALLLIGCLVVLWPFLSALLWAVVLSFTTWPAYRRMLAAVKGRQTLAALLMTLTITIVLVLPFVIVGMTMADDVRKLTSATRQWLEAGPPEPPAWLQRIPIAGPWGADYWRSFTGDGQQTVDALKQFIEHAGEWLLLGGFALGRGLIQLTLSILVLFFFYRDGAGVAERARDGAIRIAGQRGERLFLLAGMTVRGVVFGILGTALVQGVVAGIGFLIAGVPGAAVLALLTFLLSILPFGAPLIWIPATIWLFSRGMNGWGVFMLIWGIMVSSLDNIIKPWLISKGSDMPFILTFFGVIGGALAFGFIGVFLGPTLLALGYAVLLEWLTPAPPATSEQTQSVVVNLPASDAPPA